MTTVDDPILCMTLALVIGVGLGATGKAPAGSFLAWVVDRFKPPEKSPPRRKPRRKPRRSKKPARRRKHS